MKEKYINKILSELPILLEKNIIDNLSFDKMEEYYQSLKTDSGNNNLLAIISSVAGLLIGSGIILLLAHNWDEISKNTKTIIAFLPLITGQVLCFYSYFKKKSFSWSEFSAIFLSLSVGSTIALISQIYNMPGNMEGFLFIWIILIFPLIYIMDSIGVLIIYLVQIIFWAVFAQNIIGDAAYYWLFIIAVIPYFFMALKNGVSQNRTIVISWLVPITILIGTGIALEKVIPGLWIIIYSLLITMFYLSGNLFYSKETSLFHNPFKVIGTIGIIVLSYIFTFKEIWIKVGWDFIKGQSGGNFIFYTRYNHTVAIIDYILIALLIGINLFLLTRIKKYNLIKESTPFSIFTAIPIIMYITASIAHTFFVPQMIFNIYVLFIGGVIIYNGTTTKALYKINLGMGTILLIIISRFFDIDISFTIKGIIFISLGLTFLFVNLYLSKKFTKEELV